ncbi:hypothetical protein ACN08P_11120 [Photobacterium leiognathi subsp. mandapamensis]|uniref:hypothetical protein n=1 Tax=Photobacterium leiognathi TaxID=553611 RepID=UPI0029813F89|nr:hypothetical protein [Photobacterium leiognathi]
MESNQSNLIGCRKHYYIHKNKFLECSFASNEKLTHLPESYEKDYSDEYDHQYVNQSSEISRELVEISEASAVNLGMQGIRMIFLDQH